MPNSSGFVTPIQILVGKEDIDVIKDTTQHFRYNKNMYKYCLTNNRDELNDQNLFTANRNGSNGFDVDIPTPEGGVHKVRVNLALGCDMKSLWDNFGLEYGHLHFMYH